MNFNYKNYVNRYQYQPYQWPPDIGLAELHARCSEPGPVNLKGVKCPCCQRWSKKKIKNWWKRSISQDLNGYGGAIPGYFRMLKFYFIATLCAFILNSIYPLFITFYTCSQFDPNDEYCLSVGFLYYLDFNRMIEILNINGEQQISNTLIVLQTIVFYFLLFTNIFSVFFLIVSKSQKDRELEEISVADSKKCLLFYQIPLEIQKDFPQILKLPLPQEENQANVRKSVKVYKVKEYFENYNNRNQLYYHILSRYVSSENPFYAHKHNKKLMKIHEKTKQARKQIGQFCGKMVIFFEDEKSVEYFHSLYKMPWRLKWWYGFRTLLNDIGILRFDKSKMGVSSAKIPKFSTIKWENIGQDLDKKMAIRIKTFFVSILFIILCYLILYYPILLILRSHSQKQTADVVQLSPFEKFIPFACSILIVALSIGYRIYMGKLANERNPKNQLEKARFLLMTTVFFHLVFYIILPTVFFAVPQQISRTVKLYAISEQARTFIVVQLLIALIDIPYRIWKSKKVENLSDQRYAFKHNQYTLNKIVELIDYPLEIKLQTMFRVWSFVMFYGFFLPYMMIVIVLTFPILFWVEKKNLYKHYTVRRKVSVSLEVEFLILFVNFFCIYECIVYCLIFQNNTKSYFAVGVTLFCLFINFVLWYVLNHRKDRPSKSLKDELQRGEKKVEEEAQQFEEGYKKFLDFFQNYDLEDEIDKYLEKLNRKDETQMQEFEISSENTAENYYDI